METSVRFKDENNPETFRPSKRRKTYRKRNNVEDEEAIVKVPSAPLIPSELLDIDELVAQHAPNNRNDTAVDGSPSLSVAELLRLRKSAPRRKGGIEFTEHNNSTDKTTQQQNNALKGNKVDPSADIKQVIERFAPQTGQVSEATDKHMMAYIDSELARLDRRDAKISSYTSNGQELSSDGALLHAELHRQPAALGKLHEIDLGADATLRNIARTEAAQRKLDGTEPELDQMNGKLRLRRDGRPWGYRKRRNSADVKRDKLVEEVMRESKLDIYDEPDVESVTDDQAADDRIAEQFRKEFMDAVSTRRQKTTQGAKPAKGKAVEELPKGPKLGGSRSARAAMREKELAAAKKK